MDINDRAQTCGILGLAALLICHENVGELVHLGTVKNPNSPLRSMSLAVLRLYEQILRTMSNAIMRAV